MRIVLTVTAGPHKGLEFAFDRHDTFLVGRSKHAHFQLPAKDKYFSRVHFMLEVNPPACRLIDMGSHNGTFVNGAKILAADLKDGDQIRAGHTILRVHVEKTELVTTSMLEPVAGLPAVPGYLLERELGKGAMGTTYVGRRAKATEDYAIKIVTPSFQGSPAQVGEFLRSARVLMQLQHPHIARLGDVGVCPNGYFFASELIPGASSAAILARDGPLAIRRCVRWGAHLLQALEHAHARHLIHRDIKPTNVIVAEEAGKEVAKLADFGLARVYQSAPFSGLSLTADLLNLASFIPPETLFNFQEANPLADQYSIAAVLYHLLTGAPVLDLPKDERRRYSSLLRRQYVPLPERRPDVPAKLAEVIHRALSRTPSQRFANAGEFRERLVGAVHSDR